MGEILNFDPIKRGKLLKLLLSPYLLSHLCKLCIRACTYAWLLDTFKGKQNGLGPTKSLFSTKRLECKSVKVPEVGYEMHPLS